jgi:hypothetical protein
MSSSAAFVAASTANRLSGTRLAVMFGVREREDRCRGDLCC